MKATPIRLVMQAPVSLSIRSCLMEPLFFVFAINNSGSMVTPFSMAFSIISALRFVSFLRTSPTINTISTGSTTQMQIGSITYSKKSITVSFIKLFDIPPFPPRLVPDPASPLFLPRLLLLSLPSVFCLVTDPASLRRTQPRHRLSFRLRPFPLRTDTGLLYGFRPAGSSCCGVVSIL